MLVAAVQMSSTMDKAGNVEVAEALIRSAAGRGAELVSLPEMWNCHGSDTGHEENAEEIPGETTGFLSRLAVELGVYIIGGSIMESDPEDGKLYNTSTVLSPDGEIIAVYRKIHLFDVVAPDREYLESRKVAAGEEVVTADVGEVRVGLSVCYDVRFPELYRLLAERGATLLSVPAAFTLKTGRDHWELLLRARAIENQSFVIAPAQWGRKEDGRETYGRSMIVDPWWTVLAVCPDSDGIAVADLDFDYLRRFREEFPSLKNRRIGVESDSLTR